MNVLPSARMTSCGNVGTTGLGSLFGRRFHTCVRPYGELLTLRVNGTAGEAEERRHGERRSVQAMVVRVTVSD